MGGRLEGKVCVITGAGGGMGREAAVVFAEEGAKVCVADVALAPRARRRSTSVRTARRSRSRSTSPTRTACAR